MLNIKNIVVKKKMALTRFQIGLIVFGVAVLLAVGIGFFFPTWYTVGGGKNDNGDKDKKTTYTCSADQQAAALSCLEGILKSENCCSSDSECQTLAKDLMSGKVPGSDIAKLEASCLNYNNIQTDINLYEDVKTCISSGFPENWVQANTCSANAKACLCKTDDIIKN